MTGDSLGSEVYKALGRLLSSKPSVRNALEMRWILLLITTTIRELSEPVAIDKDTWVEDILELAEHGEGLRQQTGEMIAGFLEDSPWGLQRQQQSSSFDTVRTVNAIGGGVMTFCRHLSTELKKVEDAGVVLKDYDVEEAGSTEDDDSMDGTEKRDGGATRKSMKRSIRLPRATPDTLVKRTSSAAGHGNHDHGRSVPWTTPEHIGLLELYRDNTDRKIVSHPRISELHNARFWPRLGEGRTNAAVSQQYLKLVQHDVSLIPAKIAELQALLARTV